METTETIRENVSFSLIILFVCVFTLHMFTGSNAYTQGGEIKGSVLDKATLNTIPYASVTLEDKVGNIVVGVTSEINGDYILQNVIPGTYNIRASFVGYTMQIIKDLKVIDDSTIVVNILMKAEAEMMQEIVYIDGIRTSRGNSKNCRYVSPNSSGYVIYPNYQESTEDYDGVVENSFIAPQQNPLSTFSIDVDMASYSNVRRFLNLGTMPPVDAIRTEEMINYFNYDYQEPENNIPVAVSTEVARCDWNEKHKIALVGIQAKKIETEDLPPNNLVFLLDVSGSMSDANKLPLLKKSMQMLVNNLDEEDKVSIVVYAGSAGVVLHPTHGHKKEKINQAIEGLNSGGSTAGGEGIVLAYKLAEKSFLSHGNNRVILATDGDFNVGITDNDELVELIEQKRETGIYLTVLGFGSGNLKDSKMEKLADHGNGNYAYIDNLLEAQKTLVNEMGATMLTVANDVKIQVEFNPQKVQAYRLIGYENRILEDRDFNDDQKDAGDVGAGKSVTALYEIIPVGIKSDFETGSVDKLKYQKNPEISRTEFADELMTVKVRYKIPSEDKSQLLVQAVEDDETDFNLASANLRFASSVAEFAMLLRDSKLKGDADYDHAIEVANEARGEDPEGYRSEYIRLIKLAQQIQLSSLQSNLDR